MKTHRKRGRAASDGATQVERVTIALTPEHRVKLKQLSGKAGASAFFRKIIDAEFFKRTLK